MDSRQIRDLMEAYVDVYASQEIDEADSLAAMQARREKRLKAQRKREGTTSTGRDFGRDDSLSSSQQKARRDAEFKAGTKKEEFDLFDTILEFLYVEGYIDTLEEAEWMMANIINEEAIDIILGEEQLDEISQKTATKAYAHGTSDEFEGLDDPRRVERNMRLRDRIKRKFGDKAAKHADRAAHAQTFGRKGSGGMPPKPTKEEFEAWLDEAMTKYERNRKRAAQRAAARNAARDAGKTGAVPGVGYVTPRRERETWTDESGKTRHAKGL